MITRMIILNQYIAIYKIHFSLLKLLFEVLIFSSEYSIVFLHLYKTQNKLIYNILQTK